jgi:Cd2+/Zn2+-exporting ATPase
MAMAYEYCNQLPCVCGHCPQKQEQSAHNHEHAHEHKNEHESDMKLAVIRLITAAAFVAMGIVGEHLFALPEAVTAILCGLGYIAAGYDVLFGAVKDIARGEIFGENLLMSVASIGAFAIGEYAEGSAVMLLYQVGEILSDIAVNRSKKSITDTMNLRADYARVLREDGEAQKVSPESVRIGDILAVYPGERIPLDGVIVEGVTTLDTAALTGESAYRDASAGEKILSGMVNRAAVIKMRVSAEYKDSAAARILDLMRYAQTRKSKTERFVTRFSRIYTPTVIAAALLIGLVLPLIFGWNLSDWIYRGLIFLVISCPCALVISVPLGFFCGMGRAAKSGILIKGANTIDALAKTAVVVFDKTGTLTTGQYEITGNFPAANLNSDELLNLAAAAEQYSSHPIAAAVSAAFAESDSSKKPQECEQSAEIPGEGITAQLGGKQLLAGNLRLMKRFNIKINTQIDTSATLLYIAYGGDFMGCLSIGDRVKPGSKQAVHSLKRMGIEKIVMLTGDISGKAKEVAAELNLDDYKAECLPQDKFDAVEALESKLGKNGRLLFAGDGVNDAPVLARADIGTAMGGIGSDSAIEAADMVIMNDDPVMIPKAVKLSRKTLAVVKTNIIFAIAVKTLFQLLGMLGLANMWAAVIADVGVTLIAVAFTMIVLNSKVE